MTKLNFLSSDGSYLRLLLTFTLFLAASLIPVIGLLFLFTLPQLMFVLSLQHDQRKTLTAFLIPLAVIFIILVLSSSTLPALALAVMGFAGMVMTWAARKDYRVETIVLLPAAVILVAVIFYFVIGASQISLTPWQMVKQTVKQAVELNINLYSRFPISADETQAIKDSKDAIIQVFTQVFPALCITMILFIAWINMLTSKRILMKSGIVLKQFLNLSEWKAPAWMVWIFLASGGLLLIPHSQISFAGMNTFLSVSFVYLIQGLAIVSFFFQQKEISPFMRGLFYFFVAIQQILVIAIALLGFFDIWVDFRKFFRNKPALNE